MINPTDLRDRIDFLRFTLICGLVLLHYGHLPGVAESPFRGAQANEFPIATFINSYVVFFFLSAVPLLSAVSGWLFFGKCDYSVRFYVQRYRRRARSILLPMVMWCAMILVLFLAIARIAPNAHILSVVAYDLTALTPLDVANALVGLTRHPIDFQFWFLRDLFLTVLLTPLIGFILRRVPLVGLGALFLVWVTDSTLGIFFRTDVLFFFACGAAIRIHDVPLRSIASRHAIVIIVVYAALVAARTAAPLFADVEVGTLGEVVAVLTLLMRAVGVTAMWALPPLVIGTALGRTCVMLGPIAFFLHAMHWPLNQFVKAALAKVIPHTHEVFLMANYVLTFAITVGVAIVVLRFVSPFFPLLFDLLSGGRSGVFSSTAMKASYQR